uniref:Predicted protein n=1 Tax=Hordeum vulgare subsp. vulgare TaxID=112509 RepID=F2CT98_HORVV|nr:predicted protein [Hordeum vulgare subsp. vulgare]
MLRRPAALSSSRMSLRISENVIFFFPSWALICNGRARSAAGTNKTVRRSLFFRSILHSSQFVHQAQV